MTCPEARELIDLVVIDDPSLAVEVRVPFEVHLAVCAGCHEELERSQQIMALVRQHGKLSPGTIELLESHGEVVWDHLRPEPEHEEEISDEQVETGLAKLMAKLDEIDAGWKPAIFSAW